MDYRAKSDRQAAVAQQWESLSKGSRIRPQLDQIDLVVFTDYECDYCRSQHVWLEEQLGQRREVGVAVLHFPLPFHRGAGAAARAALCADKIGYFAAMHDALMTSTEWLSTLDFGMVALQAGIADTAGLSACLDDTETIAALNENRRIARLLGVDGTPYYFTARSGWHSGALSDRALSKLLRGR